MPDVDQLAEQTALLTQALKLLRQGKFEGAGGLDGVIVALQGGQPLDFTPAWPASAAAPPAEPPAVAPPPVDPPPLDGAPADALVDPPPLDGAPADALVDPPPVDSAPADALVDPPPVDGAPADALVDPAPSEPAPALVPNGVYYADPNFEADLDRYSARIGELLGPSIAAFARAQARLETGNGQLFSTPYNFGNIGNTDSNPKGGGGFDGPEAAADAWVAFVTNNGGPTRYQAFLDAGAQGADVATLARLISQAGYATDPNYAAKVAVLAD